LFVNPIGEDYTPQAPALNGTGTNLGVPVDFYGVSRNNPPDIGAIEFTPPSCFPPSALNAIAISGSTVDLSWTENNTATQWEIEYGLTGFLQGGGTTVIANTNPYNITLVPYNTYDFYVKSICTVSDTSIWSLPNTFYFVGDPLSGIYTIDSNLATAGTNFRNFTDFVTALDMAGISGPVTANVVVGSGPYNESLYLSSIVGSS